MTEKQIKKLKLEKDTVVCVVWEDTQTESAWMDKDCFPDIKPALVKSFGVYSGVINGGVFVKHNVGDVLNAVTKESENEFDGTLIPLGCILRIRKLKI